MCRETATFSGPAGIVRSQQLLDPADDQAVNSRQQNCKTMNGDQWNNEQRFATLHRRNVNNNNNNVRLLQLQTERYNEQNQHLSRRTALIQ